MVRVNSPNPTNSTPEYEKFIFYRGVGSFSTPLKVTMPEAPASLPAVVTVQLANESKERLRHLFVLHLAKQAGGFVYIDGLSPGEKRTVPIDSRADELPLAQLVERLGQSMENALTEEGLYRREAAAMVKTWRDSWFEEEGVRVLYTLPRAWTDRTLPLSLSPAPKELVRVMLGRAEVLPPALEQKLSSELSKATAGEISARTAAKEEFRRLGRFAEPALRLATRASDPATVQEAWNLLRLVQEKAPGAAVTAAVASP
jgi:hypothetical protein